MKERGKYTGVSQGAIELLQKRGMSLTQIARLIGVSKSYISRVGSGERSLTLDHLADLALKLDEPLPLLILEATPPDSLSRQQRALYRLTKKHLEGIYGRRKRSRSAA